MQIEHAMDEGDQAVVTGCVGWVGEVDGADGELRVTIPICIDYF